MENQVERPKFLVDLLAEVDRFDESLFPPPYGMEEGDKEIGTVSPWIQKLYALGRFYAKQGKMLAIERDYDISHDDPADDPEIEELKSKANVLTDLMWTLIRAELHLFNKESIGIRKDWKVVLTQPDAPDETIRKLFGGGFFFGKK